VNRASIWTATASRSWRWVRGKEGPRLEIELRPGVQRDGIRVTSSVGASARRFRRQRQFLAPRPGQPGRQCALLGDFLVEIIRWCFRRKPDARWPGRLGPARLGHRRYADGGRRVRGGRRHARAGRRSSGLRPRTRGGEGKKAPLAVYEEPTIKRGWMIVSSRRLPLAPPIASTALTITLRPAAARPKAASPPARPSADIRPGSD
jgi:hypothetical protein